LTSIFFPLSIQLLYQVYTQQELEEIAAFVQKHNLLVLSDEVYDAMTYGSCRHIRIASLPGMWDR
jgi:aspartate/methionine/tyrosine aminotransferase